MRLESDARARSVDGTVARGKMADAKNRAETRNVNVLYDYESTSAERER